MAIGDVKITDLTQAMSAETTDLFLLARPLINSEGAFEDTPYSNYSVSGDALFDSAGESIRKKPLNITGKWNFQGGKNNSPTQNLKIQAGQFVASGLEVPNHLTSILHDNEDGWYKRLITSVMQDPSHRSDQEQSIDIPNDTIPNIDFVQRLVAYAYASLQEQLTAIANGLFIPSHVGQIVISTKFSTARGYNSHDIPSNDNIRKYYGYGQVVNGIQYPDTNWIQHKRYFLKGADNGVIFNNPESDGGAESTTYNVPLKKHRHVLGADAKGSASGSSGNTKFVSSVTLNTDKAEVNDSERGRAGTSLKVSSSSVPFSGSVSFNANSAKTDETGDDPATITVNRNPPFKYVYIWERIA